MNKVNARWQKRSFSYAQIGAVNFWLGLLLGLGMAILLAYFFNYGREILRITTFNSYSLYEPPFAEVNFFNWFFCGLASLLGLGYAMWFWVQNAHGRRIHFLNMSSTLIFFFWLVLLVVTRFGSFLSIIPFGMRGYNNELLMARDFKWLFIFLLLYLFLQLWQIVQQKFRERRVMAISFVWVLLVSLALHAFTLPDRNMATKAFYTRFEAQLTYSKQARAEAFAEYGIEYDSTTIYMLDHWNRPECLQQVIAVKNAFGKEKAVSLDTIIMARILLHNVKPGLSRDCYFGCWEYATPVMIYQQLRIADSYSAESRELVKLLGLEFKMLTRNLDYSVEDMINISSLEREQLDLVANVPFLVSMEMPAIRKLILSDSGFAEFHHLFKTNNPLPPEYYDEEQIDSFIEVVLMRIKR